MLSEFSSDDVVYDEFITYFFFFFFKSGKVKFMTCTLNSFFFSFTKILLVF